MANEEVTTMTRTKEKILFETNELVISLNTQVAVLTNSNNELKRTVEGYMEKLDRQMEKMDERDATLDQRLTILRNDVTKEQTRLDGVIEDVKELKNKSNILDMISIAFTAVVGTVMYFLGQR
jgi:predicted RNase H-like nuclease (RuvC/YqgF family)